jgi:secretion/DNA translocation related TadE-like protein
MRRGTGEHPDRGSASIWVLAAGLVLMAGGLAGAAVGSACVARHQAGAAADLGALAAVPRVVEGPGPACARAAEIVAANGARLLECRVAGFEVTVTTAVAATSLPAGPRLATATSRAGPTPVR